MLYGNLNIKKSILSTLLLIALTWSAITSASIVRMATDYGNIDIELFDYDSDVLITVNNFLRYVNAGAYDQTFFHRNYTPLYTGIPTVLQGGGFSAVDNNGTVLVNRIPDYGPIINQYKYPNTRGTISMARTADPDSATTEWFFNLIDNSTSFGELNGGGYAVFGQVLGNGMDIVDAIAAIPLVNAGGAFAELPVVNYTYPNQIQYDNLVMINSVTTVPLPAAVWLFGSGLIGFIGFAYKRKK